MQILELTFQVTPFKDLGLSSLGCLASPQIEICVFSAWFSTAGLGLLDSAPLLFHSAGNTKYLFFFLYTSKQIHNTHKTIFLFPLLPYIKCSILHVSCTLLFSVNTLLNVLRIHSKRSSLIFFVWWRNTPLLGCRTDILKLHF